MHMLAAPVRFHQLIPEGVYYPIDFETMEDWFFFTSHWTPLTVYEITGANLKKPMHMSKIDFSRTKKRHVSSYR